MSLSHHIPVIIERNYPSVGPIPLSDLFKEIVAQHYAEFIRRLELFGYSFPPLDSELYYTHFGESTPASFIFDSRGSVTVRAGVNKLWLLFVHHSEGVDVLIGKYVVFERDHVLVFGDGESGLRVNLVEGRVGVSGVAIPASRREEFALAGVKVL